MGTDKNDKIIELSFGNFKLKLVNYPVWGGIVILCVILYLITTLIPSSLGFNIFKTLL